MMQGVVKHRKCYVLPRLTDGLLSAPTLQLRCIATTPLSAGSGEEEDNGSCICAGRNILHVNDRQPLQA